MLKRGGGEIGGNDPGSDLGLRDNTTRPEDEATTPEIPFQFEFNPALRFALSPPAMLQIAEEASRSAGHNGSLLTRCLLRGVPNVDTKLPDDTLQITITSETREYPTTGGNPNIVSMLLAYMQQLHGLPKDTEITLTPGGRPALDLVTSISSPDTVYVTADTTYSAVPAILDLGGKKHVTAPVNLDNFNIEEYQEGILRTIQDLKQQGVKSVVFMETLPGNPLGITYPEDSRIKFLDKLQQMGVVVVVDGFYSTYGDPDSDNFPYNAFRGVSNMNGRLFIGGVTKDGDHPDPGARAAYIAGDKNLIKAAKGVQAAAEGGVSSITQQILAQRFAQAFDGNSRVSTPHIEALRSFAENTALVREMTRNRLAQMGFKVLGEDKNGLGKAGMYLMAENPPNTPDAIQGFWEWGKHQIPPGLPLQSFAAKRENRPGLNMFKPNGTAVDTSRYAHANRVRVCIGAGMDRVSAALNALESGIDSVRQAHETN